jgi:predicted TIM-barrel fold metal-dependent hydrolase
MIRQRRRFQSACIAAALCLRRNPDSAGETDRTRQKNDELIALAKRHTKLMPIASVHPYAGAAALEELKRLAGLGVKVIKLHPHTQQFDVTDSRVLASTDAPARDGVKRRT